MPGIESTISWLLNYYYNSSRREKFFLVLSAVAFFLVIVMLIRACCSTLGFSRAAGLPPLSIIDENGKKWVLDPLKGQLLSRFQNVEKKPGPPLLVKTEARQTKSREVLIGVIVEGKAGEL
ncbi:MAG: hypothetical protein ACYS0I_11500 [Planctomycetota bacterium]|jgi:hypothetical protein